MESEESPAPWALSVLRAPATSRLARGQQIALPDHPARLGRTPDNHVVVPDPTVSRFHARLVPDPDGLHVEAVTASSGTFVDKRRLEPGESAMLRPRESRLQLGGVLFELVEMVSTDPVFDPISSGAAPVDSMAESAYERLLDVTWDAGACSARLGGRPLPLTGRTAQLLALLAGQPGRVLHYYDLFEELGTQHVYPLACHVRDAIVAALDDDPMARERIAEHLERVGRLVPDTHPGRLMLETRRGHGYILHIDRADVRVRQL